MQTDPNGERLEGCVAEHGELLRTAIRLMILNAHRGLSAAPARLRRSPEARVASQALYAASDFFNREFDAALFETELKRLSAALSPLAAMHGCDPFLLNLYATGQHRRRRAKGSPVEPRLLRS